MAARFLWRIALLLPLVAPYVTYVAYKPVNRDWTVVTFGCGCPRLDGTTRFNANHVNLILWGLHAAGCIGLWAWLIQRNVSASRKRLRLWLSVVGASAIFQMCLIFYARGVWF